MTRLASMAVVASLAVAGCTASHADDGQVRVVASTEIIADLVRNVGGERVRVDSLVPAGGDPHSYEPAPADAVKVTKADVTFTNHLLLEEHALIKVIDANTRPGALSVSLAEASETYGANVIPLVEDLGLDVIWLGLAVRGDGKARGATRASDIRLRASKVEGPGTLVAYLTSALGEPQVYFNSADGLDDSDVTVLPPAAHTHLNWAFTKPGSYRLTLTAELDGSAVGEGIFTFAVGVEPAGPGRVLDGGHTDLAVDIDQGAIYAYTDAAAAGKQSAVPADQVIIQVPNRALQEVPADPRFGFLGAPGAPIHQLPQAVLGKHVHGEIDPHLWQDVRNVKAYVQLIRDTLAQADPAGSDGYTARARAYLSELDTLDGYVREQISAIAPHRRQLITTHDAFGYLAAAYDMTVAGFVVPNPAQEPSAEQVRKLSQTIANLQVPAVFLEPNLLHRTGVLTQVAADHGVRVCKLYGDSFDPDATTYLAMMRHNADELRACLGEAGGRGGGGLAEPIVIEAGHVDVGPRFVDGTWRIQLRDDTVSPAVWRELRDVVLVVNQASRIQVPDDDRFSFLGRPGDTVWLLPQVQQAGVLWPGWNTQDPQVAAALKRAMTWRLEGVTGPGGFALFLNGAFGEPQPLFDSARPLPQQAAIDANTHAHGNWAFGAQGTYLLDMTMSAALHTGEQVTDRQTLAIRVGEAQTQTPTSSATAAAPPAPAQAFPWRWIGVVAVVLGLVSVLWLWWRRR